MAERFFSAEGGFIMRHHAISIRVFAVACGLLASASIAQAANETWVSGTGTDAGNCPRTAPCRTFQFAHDQTNNNGAINVLTSGNFGPLTITKPISIVADGVEAVINTGAERRRHHRAGGRCRRRLAARPDHRSARHRQ